MYMCAGHRSQGVTFEGDLVVDIKHAFCPGLTYVILSRVHTSTQLFIVGALTVEMFTPIGIDMNNTNV